MEITASNHNPSYINRVQTYYRFHSKIYDATRWSFLFGRKRIVDKLPELPAAPRIMEVGCGTGQNLRRLSCKFPQAKLTGIDYSPHMLGIAKRRLTDRSRITLYNKIYGSPPHRKKSFDLILLSYSLTIAGNDMVRVIRRLRQDLSDDGYIALVDFNHSSYPWFRRWMRINNVDLSGRILPQLKRFFKPVDSKVKNVYFGLWSYLMFIGKKQS